MKKIIFVIVLIVILGCSEPEPYYPISNKDYQKGTEGLAFDFLQSSPPEKVFENYDFTVSGNLKNNGAYTSGQGFATLILEDSYACITDKTNCIDGAQTIPLSPIYGRSVNYPAGDSVYVEFPVQSRQMDPLSVQHTTPVILTTCYEYMTEISEEVCIDPDPNSFADKVCSVDDIALTDQGSPIAVTKIETNILPHDQNVRPQWIITIENKGTGKVLESKYVQGACSSDSVGIEHWNKVTLTDFKFSNEKYKYPETINCEPNPVRLMDGVGHVRCTIQTDDITKADPSYVTQVYMRFDFGYVDTFSKNMIIEKTR